ncbi:hypothetical protein PsorP6_018360 [Peronosclerospora sorghi]|nr:hypothetical protein PsorP6_018356 [Peronosclerospora sorghi]KAI9895933.1 hypothetical protein PsorP6_018360 [Peronosclerospora sorghi]
MTIYGQSDFSMSAHPTVSEDDTTVLYDVFATFITASKFDEIVETNYILLDGCASLTTTSTDAFGNRASHVMCLDSESDELPPVNTIVDALNKATLVSSSTSSRVATECSNGLFNVSVNGISFALCASDATDFTLRGSDMDISVVQRDKVEVPVKTAIDHRCGRVVSPSTLTPTGRAFLTGQRPISKSRRRHLKQTFHFWNDHESSDAAASDVSCSCNSRKRSCLFIHGMGVDREEPENLDSFPAYWGNLTDHAPCCDSLKYAVLNTVDHGWTEDALQQKVCDRALAVSASSSSSVIVDTILITHSMGNLMVAGALANGKCELDASSTWVGIAGPMEGSMASDFVQKSCDGDTDYVLEKVANITGRCPATEALKSVPAEGGEYSSKELDAAYRAAQEVYRDNVAALMCSDGFLGLQSKYRAEFWALGELIPYKSDGKNDGMVSFTSCAAGIPDSKFEATWKSPFYRTKLNHYDSEFLYGDSDHDERRMPIKWFECLL